MTNAERIAKRAKTGRRLLVAAVAAACILGLYAVVENVQQGNDITNVHNDVTKIEHSPCAPHPSHPSNRCEVLRQTLAASESIVAACISHQRTEGTKGRNCPRVYVDLRRGGAPEPHPQGGDAPQPSTGHQQLSPPSGGKSGGSGAGKGGHGGGHSPGHNPGSKSPPPTPEATSAPASGDTGADISTPSPGNSEGNGSSEEAPANPIADGVGKGVEDIGGSVGGVVKETGDSVNGAVGQAAEGAVCGSLAAPGCSK